MRSEGIVELDAGRVFACEAEGGCWEGGAAEQVDEEVEDPLTLRMDAGPRDADTAETSGAVEEVLPNSLIRGKE